MITALFVGLAIVGLVTVIGVLLMVVDARARTDAYTEGVSDGLDEATRMIKERTRSYAVSPPLPAPKPNRELN